MKGEGFTHTREVRGRQVTLLKGKQVECWRYVHISSMP